MTRSTQRSLTGAAAALLLPFILLSCDTTTEPAPANPEVSIASPASGAGFVEGDAITFQGSATADGGAAIGGGSLAWSSSVDGELGSGATLVVSTLTVAQHLIRLTATDAEGRSASDTTTVVVLANTPPTAAILAPEDGATAVEGDAVSFVGAGEDAEDGPLSGAALAWTSDRDGNLATGKEFTRSDLSVGTHLITLTVTDSHGASTAATVTLTIEAAPVTAFAAQWVTASSGPGAPFTCALDPVGAPFCWGGVTGTAGGGGETPNPVPVPVGGGHTFVSVEGGYGFACALSAAGAAHCWGTGEAGQLGDGQSVDRSEPAAVAGGHSWAMVAPGGGWTPEEGTFHACGVTTEGDGYCWGSGGDGQLGNGSAADAAEPTLIAGGHAWSQITTGPQHSCGVTTAGAAYCWGRLNLTQSDEPVAVPGGLVWSSLSAGSYHMCGITTGAEAYCWGDDSEGQSASGEKGGTPDPTQVVLSEDMNWTSLVAGNLHTCGLTTEGEAYCWGTNSRGQLGDATSSARGWPMPVSGGHSWQSIASSGANHTCGITTDSATYCWGDGWAGQLGDGGEEDRFVPVPVTTVD